MKGRKRGALVQSGRQESHVTRGGHPKNRAEEKKGDVPKKRRGGERVVMERHGGARERRGKKIEGRGQSRRRKGRRDSILEKGATQKRKGK